MWNLSSDDVQHAKERISRHRAELEARYAEERKALDAEDAVVETLERSAAEFAQKYVVKPKAEEPAAAVPPPVAEAEPVPETAAPAGPDRIPVSVPAVETAAGHQDGKHGSRWRLHLGGRPDGEGQVGAVATR